MLLIGYSIINPDKKMSPEKDVQKKYIGGYASDGGQYSLAKAKVLTFWSKLKKTVKHGKYTELILSLAGAMLIYYLCIIFFGI